MPKKRSCFVEIFLSTSTRTEKSISIARTLSAGRMLLLMLAIGGWLCAPPTPVEAQAAGNKTVYKSSTTTAASTAWIDASAFWTSGNKPDLCKIINGILTSATGYPTYPATGAVIDARGLYNSSGPSAISCTGTPFDNLSNSPPPTTILLPATNIPITQTWVLPDNMKIVGEVSGTFIVPQTGTWSPSDVIDMGSSAFCSTPCSGIAVEHLYIIATNNPNLNGIVNNYAGSSSYVNDISFKDVGCAALVIGAQSSDAANSGPYTNISSSTSVNVLPSCSGGGPEVSYPLCIDIETQTQGIRGATCNGTTSPQHDIVSDPPHAAIYVNASNNTVEDIHVETFWDAVQIGDVASTMTTVSNVLLSNVVGGNNGSGPVQNIVHICGKAGTCMSYGTVQDVSVLQATYVTPPGPTAAATVEDDVTGTSIPVASTSLTGMYVLGENIDGGHSRFSTSPSAITSGSTSIPTAPTWSVGNVSLTTNAPCRTPGDLYSNTGTSGMSVYVCMPDGWQPIP